MEQRTMTEMQRQEKRRRARRAKRRRTIITCFLVLLILAASSVALYFAYLYKQEQSAYNLAREEADAANQSYQDLMTDLQTGGYITREEADALSEEAVRVNTEDIKGEIRTFMEDAQTLSMLESFFPENIVVPNTGGYVFFDIDENLAKTDIDFDKLEYPVLNEETDKYEGEARYEGAKKGIDVSKFQEKINWTKVKNDGIEFAYIRIGFRGYESGKLVVDDNFEDNIEACNDKGIDCGVYFFTEAKTKAEGVEEAEFVLENLGDYDTQLPIVIDVEQSSNVNKSRTKNLTAEERTDIVIAFCERIKEAGYEPMIYGNLKSLMIMMDITRLEDYDKWFAYYHYPYRFPYKVKMWQYTSTGTVDGIKGDTDINLMFY